MKARACTCVDAFLPTSARRGRWAEQPSLRLGTHWSPPCKLPPLTYVHILFCSHCQWSKGDRSSCMALTMLHASKIFHVVSPVEVCSELFLQSSFSLADKNRVPLSFASTRVTLKLQVRHYSRAEISEPRSCEIQGFTKHLQQHYVQ